MTPLISTNPALPLPAPPNEMVSKQAEQTLKQKRQKRTQTVKKMGKKEKEEGNAAAPRRGRGQRGDIIDRTV